ncbi:hypothetical protein G6F46_015540 [Rhizopus delemar]|nr:hypothetical protein G6F46_015540 [Rhizopus delemar]
MKAADASDLDAWWDGKPFDAVLADVPCTASGIVRRHPDIRWLRRENDVRRTATLQTKILDSLWQTVAPGGRPGVPAAPPRGPAAGRAGPIAASCGRCNTGSPT